jgi:hypothetical protein
MTIKGTAPSQNKIRKKWGNAVGAAVSSAAMDEKIRDCRVVYPTNSREKTKRKREPDT